MSPILVRPVREQLEHDRVIRLLQAKSRRRYEAGINPGSERNAAVGNGPSALYPDLVLQSLERGHRLQAVVEVETGESVNHLEALAQWAPLAKLRVPFHLYVPDSMMDVARRLCEDNQIDVSELWSYQGIGDQVRFTLVHRSREAAAPQRAAAPRPASSRPVARTAKPKTAKPVRRPAKSSAPTKKRKSSAKPASRPASKPARKTARKPARPQKRR